MRASAFFALILIYSSFSFAASAPKNNTFTFRMLSEPVTLDWNKAHTSVETHLMMNLMEGLVAVDSNLKVVPAIAKSWTRSADGRTYTFFLRDDVKWSDGVQLKANDFIYSWKRLLSPLTAASYAYLLFDIEGAEYFYKGAIKDFNAVGVKAINDYTIQVKLIRPVAYWIYIPTFWVTFPMRQDIIEKHGAGWERPGRMVTVGPYTLAVHDIDSKIVLRANPHYYGQRGDVEQAVGQIVRDDSTALSLYESGKLDFLTDIATLDLKRLAGRKDLKAFPYLKVGYLGFAVNNYPISNPKVRRAIAMAIDKKKIPQILHGGQQPATSFVPPKLMAYSETAGLAFNPLKARAELAGAGIDPARTSLNFLMPNFDKSVTLGQYIQEELKKNLGLKVGIQSYDHKTFRAQLELFTYPMYESSWAADYPDPDNFLSIFLSTAGNNRTNWKDSRYDETITEAKNLLDPKDRARAYAEAQKILLERDAVIVPLYYEPNMALIKDRAQGCELNPMNYLFLKKIKLK